ncbi:hypothetical protein [Sporomusa aerivorans]
MSADRFKFRLVVATPAKNRPKISSPATILGLAALATLCPVKTGD